MWAGVVSWLLVKALLWYLWMFVGPLLLISGAVLTLIGTQHKAGSIVSLVGCFIVTVMKGYLTEKTLRDLADPLIMRPPYGLYAIAWALILMADARAVHFYRVASLPVSMQCHMAT